MAPTKKLSIALACAAVLASLAAVPAPAQSETPDTYLELLRSDVRAARVGLLTESLELTEEESELFWPIFREYDTELSALGDRRIALVDSFLESLESATDEEVSGLAKEWFAIQKDYAKLRKRYFNKVSKAVGVRVAARFTQTENLVRMLMELQLAAELPLVE